MTWFVQLNRPCQPKFRLSLDFSQFKSPSNLVLTKNLMVQETRHNKEFVEIFFEVVRILEAKELKSQY